MAGTSSAVPSEGAGKVLSNSVGITSLLTFIILVLAWLVGFASRLFAIVRFESIIHEFDPWFNYRATHHMVEHGFYNFLNWFDDRAWYPLGRIVGGTVYPGLMLTSGGIHYILSMLNIPVHIRDVCVFLAPTFSGLTAIATYFLTKELWTPGAGLFAACFIAISPGYTSRSVAGSYDNEGIAIFALQGYRRFTAFLVGALYYLTGGPATGLLTLSFTGNKRLLHYLYCSGLTAIATYFLTKELWTPGAGLFAACFIAISPGYTSRSVAGSYDNEGIAIFALQFTYFLWVRSVKTGSVFWASLTALSYFYMVSAWGGYVFIINLIPLHVLTLVLIGRYSSKLYVAYTTFYVLGQVMAMQIPFVGFQPVKTSEHMAAAGVFGLLQELWTPGAGLFAACFIAISPGYTSRSVAGSYDNEGIAIFALQFTYFLWVRSVKTGSVFWASLTALSYFYMVSAWGGYVFIINLIPLHVLTLVLIGRYSSKLYVAYTTFYVLGQVMAMQIPFVGFQPVKTSEHMAAAGVFGLLQVIAVLKYAQRRITRKQFVTLFIGGVSLAFLAGLALIVLLTYAGYIAPWSGRFYSLWDTGYAKIHIPIIASVSEHQPTTWVSFFFDLHITAAVFPAGLWYCVKNVNDERVFIILYAVTAVYFAGVMVRLMLTLTPVVCVLSGIAFSYTYEKYLVDDGEQPKSGSEEEESKHLYDKAGKSRKGGSWTNQTAGEAEEASIGMNARSIVSVVLVLMLLMFVVHCTYVTSNAYSHPSVVLQSHTSDGGRVIMDDFREAYYWLRKNTEENARVMSWWDYGYQIAGMANRTTLVDNNTWNNSHIALVGKAMSSNESAAYEIMHALDVDYVLAIFGGVIGYSGDDINKFLWMVRIAEGEYPKEIRESNYFSESGDYTVGAQASETMLNCLMYKISYYRFGEIKLGYQQPAGLDRTRGYVIGKKDIVLEHLEEAYTSENWLVRIYKVKKPANRPVVKYQKRQIKSWKPTSISKKGKSRRGILKGKPVVIKGKRPSSSQP
ncbi:Dolichyl-diphosphooligosaccharide--protein glycosyltransferase subunit STT3 [Toxocara canis]|uniref:dolichyl-diphosphooligosaccharide--protein glycotransferase n=1 Tax=Toxocara canis TaxID=6265 RepID=A0A0B2VL25_TOXCA|nr:Dolichyl-diphosphooligosaccharide--protein glycosyltransferase subunit STT3 [Toxocara canis]